VVHGEADAPPGDCRMNETVNPDAIADARRAPLPAPEPLSPMIAPAPSPAPKRIRLGRIVVVLGIALVLIAGGLYYEKIGTSTLDASRPAEPKGPPPQTVRAAEAVSGDMPITIDALGTVTPLATVTIKTQIAGKLMQVGFTEGQMVKEGDFLAQIDPRPFEATLAQAQGQLAKDTSLYQQAQADLARYVTLNKQDSIAHQQVDDQTFLVAQDKAAITSDQATIDAAKLNIYYTHIVSPITGRVGLRLVDAGNYVQTTDATGLVVITQLDPISVVFSTPEDNLTRITHRLNSGATLPVTVFDRSNVKQLATGTLTTFDNQIDTTTGTFKLRATFANPDNALFPSQFVNVRLLVDTVTGAVLVPNAAIQLGSMGSFVYVVKDDSSVTVHKIVPGAADATRTVVTDGLAVGDKVVIDGADRLREGSKVKVSTAKADGGAAGADGAAGGAGRGSGSGDGSGQHQHRHRQGAGDAATDAPPAGAAPVATPTTAPSPSIQPWPSPKPSASPKPSPTPKPSPSPKP
jgi:multidrug efflux system membrane fusion protein